MRLIDTLHEPVYFITGIDTDCGKTVATGTLSSMLRTEGCNCITQKLIQTGCKGTSDDIVTHRNIEGRPLTEEDAAGLTCPLIYSFPCSPHMAVAIDGGRLDLTKAVKATASLLSRYDKVLLEGAGGVMVPLTEEYLTIDYIVEHSLPVILVTTAKLGSINHTLLNLELLSRRNISVAALVYNRGIATDPRITEESERYLRSRLIALYPSTHFIPLDHISR